MKHIKKFEGFFDKVSGLVSRHDKEEDKIAKNIINMAIPKLDVEEIEFKKDDNRSRSVSSDLTYLFRVSGSPTKVSKNTLFGAELFKSDTSYTISIEGDELCCSASLKKKIFDMVDNIYKEEQRRQKLQRITTNTSL